MPAVRSGRGSIAYSLPQWNTPDKTAGDTAMVLKWIRRHDPTMDKELKDFRFTDKPVAHKSSSSCLQGLLNEVQPVLAKVHLPFHEQCGGAENPARNGRIGIRCQFRLHLGVL